MWDGTLDFLHPDMPTDDAFIKSLNGKFRVACLNKRWAMNFDGAVEKLKTSHGD